MDPRADRERLAVAFREWGDAFTRSVPMYAGLAHRIADTPDLLDLLAHAPREQQLPVLLFNAVHALVLADPGSSLAEYYPSVTTPARRGDPFPAFAALCRECRDAVIDIVRSRSTQTNEVGRCRFYLPALGVVSDEVGPLALVDVGASAGLNLQLDRFHYDFAPGGRLGPASPVELVGELRGGVLPPVFEMPRIAYRVGLDRAPVDLGDPAARDWLRACVWAEQRERFERLTAAIDIARAHPVEVRRGDAVTDLAGVVTDASGQGHPVVMNSWVLNYLTSEGRRDYVTELDRLGRRLDLSWVYAESPGFCDHLPFPEHARQALTVLMLVRWRGGVRAVEHLADCHPHGEWLHWIGAPVH